MESKCTTRQRENKAGSIYGWQLPWRKASPRATFDIMKSRRNFTTRVVLIFAFVCAISVTSAIAQGAPQGGRLIVDRAPNFGWNLAVHLKIDGRAVADIVQGRHFDGSLPAGRHVLTASAVPATYFRPPTSIPLTVRPGHMYVFTAVWDSDVVVLRPL